MKKVLLTWGYDSYTGERYLDTYYEIPSTDVLDAIFSNDGDKIITKHSSALNAIVMRNRIHNTHAALFSVDDYVSRDDIECIVKYSPELLEKAKFNL